ncbi:MAG: hypothetical protein ACKO81_07480 [Planctomycetota bacterium]
MRLVSSSICLLLVSCLPLFAQDTPRHSVFIAGPTFTGILDEDGKEIWNSGRGGARDGCVLANGNALICWTDEVRELTRDKKETVFHYKLSKDNQELGTVQRLDDGKTLITELGAKPVLLEVDPDGTVSRRVPLQPETDNGHMQTRMARKLANGNYLVPHLLAFKVKEYDPTGKVVREITTDREELGGRAAENWPFTAIRLANGNTLVNLTHGNKTVEFDPEGRIVWKASNEDVAGKPFDDPCGAQRLPNGNTVIASYHAPEQEGVIKIFELTPDKQIVWKYAGPHRAHELQILTTNGQPVEGKPLR